MFKFFYFLFIGSVFAGFSYFWTSVNETDSSLNINKPKLSSVSSSNVSLRGHHFRDRPYSALFNIATFNLKSSNAFGWKTFTLWKPLSVPIGHRYSFTNRYKFKYRDNWMSIIVYRDQGNNKSESPTTPKCFLTWRPLSKKETDEEKKSQKNNNNSIEDFIKKYILGDTSKKSKKPSTPNLFCTQLSIDNLTWE